MTEPSFISRPALHLPRSPLQILVLTCESTVEEFCVTLVSNRVLCMSTSEDACAPTITDVVVDLNLKEAAKGMKVALRTLPFNRPPTLATKGQLIVHHRVQTLNFMQELADRNQMK